tara:strand:+ start:624 stop:791 length:168 start_codon:yes stop_codon:yes gene_type:complete
MITTRIIFSNRDSAKSVVPGEMVAKGRVSGNFYFEFGWVALSWVIITGSHSINLL